VGLDLFVQLSFLIVTGQTSKARVSFLQGALSVPVLVLALDGQLQTLIYTAITHRRNSRDIQSTTEGVKTSALVFGSLLTLALFVCFLL
jgi:hypothetical protein